MALFWNVIMAALIAVSSSQLVTDRPSILHNWDGLLTAALAAGYAAWFFFLMTVRASRRREDGPLLDRTRLYLLLVTGFALTVSLVLLHNEYVGLVFADMGIAVFALDGPVSLVPVVFLGMLFLYATGALQSGVSTRLGSDVLSIVATSGLIYTLATVIRQRVERDALIAELEEAHRDLRVASARDVELAALRERNRLAREMHDSLGHALVLIVMKIEAAQRLQAVDPERAAAEWEATKALVRSTMRDLRSSLAGLRLPVLEEQPLSSALADLATGLQESAGVEVDMHVGDEVDALDRGVQEALYRVAQEALANVARHARARRAWLRVTLDAGTAQLLVEDDGVGLDAAGSTGEHFGVVGMRERVEALAGSFSIKPRPAGGVELRATVPVGEEADARHPHLVG
jgi:signal transduction histidine kinase